MTLTEAFEEMRGDRLRLRTLILLRWMAIAGQLGALLVARHSYGIQVPMGLCAMAVGAAVIANLLAYSLFPPNKRLSETEALMMLLFDLTQLSLLLYLTGGLTNPFAILVLAPVTVSASALELRSTLLMGALAAGFVTLVASFNVPLRTVDGAVLRIPPLFTFGFWLSLLIGIAFLGLYSRRVATEMRSMAEALLATQMALAREQKLTDLGGVVAAAAHEMGTPLATIKLVSSEMIDELDDQPDLRDDALLIREQADRCRDILRSMGKAGKDDLHLKSAPLGTVLHEAAVPHLDRGREVIFLLQPAPGCALTEPLIQRRPELIHGLRNLVQNAVDFARSKVWVEGQWSDSRLVLRIIDDGDGYPPHLLGRIGDPFLRSRRAEAEAPQRPGYEGMGLGLFIAKTLLARTGAEITFANASDPFLTPEERPERCGAIVEVVWPVGAILAARGQPLGENRPIA